MEINKVLTSLNLARGLGSTDQCYCLMYAIARAFQCRRIVEIGTHRGASALVFCQAVLDNHQVPTVWTVDNLSAVPEVTDNQRLAISAEADRAFRAAGFDQYIIRRIGDSAVELPKLFQQIGSVDLVFIDGDHVTEAVVADYRASAPYTSRLLFHDSAGLSVQRALDVARTEGWAVVSFPTAYVEGDGHSVGIALAIREG